MDNETVAVKRGYHRLDFSLEQEEKLIEFVRRNPALFNPKDVQFRNKTYRDRLWADFGSTINKTGISCCKRWVNIRDMYNRTKGKELGTGNSALLKRRRNNLMSFLNRISTNKNKTSTNIEFVDIVKHEDDYTQNNQESTSTNISDFDDEQESVQPTKRQRISSNEDQVNVTKTITKSIQDIQSKIMDLFQQIFQQNDKPKTELELYFASICRTCEKFDPLTQAQIKFEINNIVSKCEIGQCEYMSQT